MLLSTAPFFMRPVREAFEHAARAGFEGVEVMVAFDKDSQDPERLAALADEFDLRIGAIHAPFLVFTKNVFGARPVSKIQRSAALAESVGAPVVVAHPPYRWQAGYRAWLRADELSRLQADHPTTTLTMENMFPIGISLHRAQTPEQLDRFGALTLDTSHAAVSGLDITDLPSRFGSRLRHVHLSNNTGRGRDSHARLTEGVLPIPEFLQRLGETRGELSVSLELDLRPWMNDPAALTQVLTAQRRFVEAYLPVTAPSAAPISTPRTSLAPAAR